jgi:hypothetical protein
MPKASCVLSGMRSGAKWSKQHEEETQGAPAQCRPESRKKAEHAGVKGVCVWCGHRYYKWSDKAQDAHLSKCSVYRAAERET